MKKLRFTIKSIILGTFILTCASLAHGQQRTFVSGTGNDANDCSRATPCRNFQRGHNAVAAGGEVVALDSAGYGPLTIDKSVTISGEGVRAAMSATGPSNVVTINAADATVILRELTITGNGGGANGVRVNDAATVYIERCLITSFTGHGIDYQTNNRLFVTDTVSRSNGGDGLFVDGAARINVDRSRFEKNANGIQLFDTSIEASITNSIMSENGFDGLVILTSGNTRANVAHSTAANNGNNGFAVFGAGANELNIEYSVARGNGGGGMVVLGGDTIRVSNSVATNNATGFNNVAGTFVTRGNNTVAGNTTNIAGATTPLPAL